MLWTKTLFCISRPLGNASGHSHFCVLTFFEFKHYRTVAAQSDARLSQFSLLAWNWNIWSDYDLQLRCDRDRELGMKGHVGAQHRNRSKFSNPLFQEVQYTHIKTLGNHVNEKLTGEPWVGGAIFCASRTWSTFFLLPWEKSFICIEK